jgi:hypothetical protein
MIACRRRGGERREGEGREREGRGKGGRGGRAGRKSGEEEVRRGQGKQKKLLDGRNAPVLQERGSAHGSLQPS